MRMGRIDGKFGRLLNACRHRFNGPRKHETGLGQAGLSWTVAAETQGAQWNSSKTDTSAIGMPPKR